MAGQEEHTWVSTPHPQAAYRFSDPYDSMWFKGYVTDPAPKEDGEKYSVLAVGCITVAHQYDAGLEDYDEEHIVGAFKLNLRHHDSANRADTWMGFEPVQLETGD